MWTLQRGGGGGGGGTCSVEVVQWTLHYPDPFGQNLGNDLGNANPDKWIDKIIIKQAVLFNAQLYTHE